MAMTAKLEFTNLQKQTKMEDAASRNPPRRRNLQRIPLIALNTHNPLIVIIHIILYYHFSFFF